MWCYRHYENSKVVNTIIRLIQEILLELESFSKGNIPEKHKLKHVLLEHYMIQLEEIGLDNKTTNELNEYLQLLNKEINRLDLRIIKSIYN